MINITEVSDSVVVEKTYENIGDIDISEIDNGTRYIGKLSVSTSLEKIIFNFSFGLASEKIRNYSGNKKYVVVYFGYGNSGWCDSDSVDDLLVKLNSFLEEEIK